MSWRTSRRRRGREVRNQMSKRPPYTEIQGLCLPWCLVKTLKFVIASSERLNLLSPIYLLCSACFQAKRSQMPSVLSCQSPSSHHMSDGPHNTATTKTPPQSLLLKITTISIHLQQRHLLKTRSNTSRKFIRNWQLPSIAEPAWL